MIPGRTIGVFYIFLVVVAVDQFTKYIVLTKNILPVYYNRTVAFSLPIPWFLPWVALLLFLSYFVYTSGGVRNVIIKIEHLITSRILYIALPLIAGGGISNIIDRIIHNGTVVDFIDLKYWPVFNVADSAIVVGVLLIIYHLYKKGEMYGFS